MIKSIRLGQWHCQGPKGTTSPACAPAALRLLQLWPGARTPFQLLQGSTLPWPETRTLNCESLPQKCHSRTSLQLTTALPCLATGPFPSPWRCWMPGARAGAVWGWGCLSSCYPGCCHPEVSPHPPLVAPWQPLYKTTSALPWTMSQDHFPPVSLSLTFSSLEERRHQKNKLTGLLKTFSNAFCKLGGNKGVSEKQREGCLKTRKLD